MVNEKLNSHLQSHIENTESKVEQNVISGSKLLEQADQSFEQIKSALLNPRAISKKHDIEGRKTTGAEIFSIMAKKGDINKSIETMEEFLGQTNQKMLETQILNSETVLVLGKRLETLIARFKKLIRVKDQSSTTLLSGIETMKKELEELNSQSSAIKETIDQYNQKRDRLPHLEKMLEAYYAQMGTIPLSIEEKKEHLKPEFLSNLSTKEYIALWRRLNPHFLSHVTRQGFRDHNAMVYHSSGMRDFHNGLIDVLQDNKMLRPPIAIHDGLLARDEKSIKKMLKSQVLKAKNEEEAKERLNDQLNLTLASAPHYPDKIAVHFATQKVADDYYGGEKNNEIFFLYPSDVLASQYDYAFNGLEEDFTKPQSETKWNDVFIWPSTLNNPGIPIDAGFVFLPENIPVDSKTGSKYASEIKTVGHKEKRVLTEDKELIDAFVEWTETLDNKSPVILAFKGYQSRTHSNWNEKERECYAVFRKEIMKIGFTEEAAVDVGRELLNGIDGINRFEYNDQIGFGDSQEDVALRIIRVASANWRRAENTITAKEYWLKYFSENPEQKPKHIIFYDGDPTSAIHDFQKKHNIGQADISKKYGQLLGFDNHHIVDMAKDPRAKRGYDELVKMAYRIIARHFSNKEKE